ncbi:MAG: OB-fold putative lipoprotein [Spirochaetaceae bacterium]|jgi:hypothetical protein|nr:OB-fold putative lipoprotein [Spirochaetaceae bacterium]
METTKKGNKLFPMGMLAMLLTFGCQTTVPVSYTEPARLNMSGVNRVAIDSDDAQAAAYISQELTGTGKYTVAADSELQEWKQWRADNTALLELADYQKGATEISPAELVKAYTDNAARADSSYGGHVLKISGAVEEIQQGSKGSYFARLGVGNNSVDVYFRPSEVQKIASLNKGQQMTIFGDCNGFKRPDMEDTAEILRILGAGQHVNIIDATFPAEPKEYPGTVDAVITLNTTSSTQDDSHVVKRNVTDSEGNAIKDAEGKTVQRDVTIYDRTVTVTINYDIVRARDGSPIGNGEKSATSPQSSSEDRSKLPAASDLAARTINTPLRQLAGEMVPTSRSLSVTLAKSDNKEAKSAINDALKLVKAKDYAGAAQAYGKIYAQYKDFASGYNQAVLTEVAQGTEEAIGLMETLVKSTNNPTAQRMLGAMQQRNAANQQAAQQLSE